LGIFAIRMIRRMIRHASDEISGPLTAAFWGFEPEDFRLLT